MASPEKKLNDSSDSPEKEGIPTPGEGRGQGEGEESSCETDESILDEAEDDDEDFQDDLDEFLNNAEGLSDQTQGDMLYSLSTDPEKSLSKQNTLNDSVSNANFLGLSCSMICENSHLLSSRESDIIQRIHDPCKALLKEKDEVIGKLSNSLKETFALVKSRKGKNGDLKSNIARIQETFNGISQLSNCSMEDQNYDGSKSEKESFRLSSYMKPHYQQTSQQNSEESVQHSRSSQTTPTPPEVEAVSSLQNSDPEIKLKENEVLKLCQFFLMTTKSVKEDLTSVRSLIRQPFENREDFPINKIMTGLEAISKQHDAEVVCLKNQLATDSKHHKELQSSLKDEIRTLTMRLKDKIKQRDSELADMRGRLMETNENEDHTNESRHVEMLDNSFQPHEDLCNSNSDDETCSNLTRTKVEYLKLTPSEYVEDEVIEAVHIPDSYRQMLEDYKSKLDHTQQMLKASKLYIDDLSHEREMERDEFQQTVERMQNQVEELKKENTKLCETNKQNIYQMEEYVSRLKHAEENETEVAEKLEATQKKLDSTVEKVFELREIIRDLESQVDSLSTGAIQLKEQNQALLDELEKQELLNKKDQPVYKEEENYDNIPSDLTDEIQAQLYDLAKRIEFKVSEMDNFSIHTRPNSQCSGVASAVSTEDISCRELAGRSSRNMDNFIEDIGSRMFNAIHRLDGQFESLVRIEDVIFKKMKDTELRCAGQKIRVEELENQISNYQDKCTNQALKIADLEGKIDSLRFESNSQHQAIVASLNSRLTSSAKQLEELKSLLTKKERDLSEAKTEIISLTTKFAEIRMRVKSRDAFCQTNPVNEEMSFTEFAYEGASPEKIRRMESANLLSTSEVSASKNILQEGYATFEPDLPMMASLDDKSRTGCNSGADSTGNKSLVHRGNDTIQEMDDNLQELQRLLAEKDNAIRALEKKLAAGRDGKNPNCEQENVTLDIDLNPKGSVKALKVQQIQASRGDADGFVYETLYASEYEVDGGLLKYLGTKLLSEGPRRDSPVDHRQGRIQETDRQIEIATLNTQIHQLKRLLEEEQKKTEYLKQQLKHCEEEKAVMRSRSPAAAPTTTSPVIAARVPIQNVTSSASVQQLQHRELVQQIEDGRSLLNEKQKEIRALHDHVTDLESNLNAKLELERELTTRLNSTITLLRKCEEHGRELSLSNQEFSKEIRRLRGHLDRANSRSSENGPVSASGNEYLENFLRAKSHRKALAWQKKYLSSVIVGYKSIVRQVGHGIEHPELLQPHIPLAPGAVGLVDVRSPKTIFRVGVLTVLAVIRMKYMVTRWYKKRPGEGSPDSEYKMSKHSLKVDSSIIRPVRGILISNKTSNYLTSSGQVALADNNLRANNRPDVNRRDLEDISEYLNRFESIENEISSSLSRNLYPS